MKRVYKVAPGGGGGGGLSDQIIGVGDYTIG